MNYIFPAMLVLSLVSAALTGRMAELSSSVIDGTESAAELLISLAAIMSFWSGIMEIAERSGAAKRFSLLLSPVFRAIFPRLKKEEYAMQAISMNVTANILGLGNAATPLGLEAMKRLQQINPDVTTASDEMVVFVVMNSAAMRIIPTTVAAIRGQYGSEDPMEIMVPTVLTTFCAMVTAVTVAKLGCRIYRWVGEKKCSQL